MFSKYFRRRFPPDWDERRHERPHRHGPRPGRHGGGPWARQFERSEDQAFWFAPGGHDRFGRHGWRGGPFGDDPFDEDGGWRRRQRRGDIKYVLLELLAEQPRHGYDLIKALEQRSAGFYRPSPGSVYPTLQLLEDEGHLTSESVEGKRVYTITDSGRQLLAEREQHHADDARGMRPPFGRHGRPDLGELRRSGMGLIASVMEAARHGTPEQIQAVMALLDTTRREIYAILAQQDATEKDTD